MPRFFCTAFTETGARITGEDALHIARSLRCRPGEILTLCDSRGLDYTASIETLSPEEVILSIIDKQKNETEPDVKVTLFQCLPKGEKLDGIIQKAVELGVYAIVPVLSERCIACPDPEAFSKRRLRLQRIAEAAAKQCGRGIIPAVLPLRRFSECLPDFAEAVTLFFYEGGRAPLTDHVHKGMETLHILVGPEGGFSEEEASAAQGNGAKPVSLGKRILRTETAPIAALAAIMLLSGNME